MNLTYSKSFTLAAKSAVGGDIAFVARAVSDDETRYFMNVVQIEASSESVSIGDFKTPTLDIVATDGRRLHIVRMDKESAAKLGIEPGKWTFEVKGGEIRCSRLDEKSEADMGQFPQWAKVVPKDKPVATAQYEGYPTKRNKKMAYSRAILDFLYSLPEQTVINFAHLDDLGTDTGYGVSFYAPNKAICFRVKNRLAVVMPMTKD